MQNFPDLATVIIIALISFLVSPLLKSGIKIGYQLSILVFKAGTSLLIASIIVGLMKDSRTFEYINNFINSILVFFGVSDVSYVTVPEQAKSAIRTAMKDGVIGVLNYL